MESSLTRFSHPNYEELAKSVALHLTRLRELIQNISQDKLSGKFSDDVKPATQAIFDRVQDRFKSSIVNMQDKASICGASPSSIIERAARVSKIITSDM